MQELPIAFEGGRPARKSSVLKVRQALADLIGEKAVALSEGLGRLVISTSREIKVPGYPQMPAGALASLTNLANEPTFRKIIADGRAARKRAIEAIGDVGDCAIVRKDKGDARWKMILRDASEPGKWRTQSFDARGFAGHLSFATRELAIEDAATSGYSVRDDGALDRIQDSPAFQRGLFTTDLIRLINSGEITHGEGDRRLAAYDQTAQALHSVAEAGAQAFIASAGEIIYLLADRINEGTEQAVFLHEIVHRHGRSVLGQAGWNRMNRTLKGWSVQPVGSVERLIHDRALARAKAAAGGSSCLLEEEFFAYSVEEAVTMGVKPSAAAHPESAEKWLDTVVTTFERIVSGILDGQPAKSMSAQQVVDMAYALAQIENPARMAQILERMTPQQRQVLEGVVARTAAPPWYSQLTRQVRQQHQDAMPAKQWMQWLSSQTSKGVKPDEIQWSGVLDWLELQKGRVAKETVLRYLESNGVQVQEVVMGERTQTAFTIEPNGDAFDVVGHEGGVIGTESSVSEAEELRDYYQDTYGEGFNGAQPKYQQYTLPGGENYREVLLTLPNAEEALREKMRNKYPQWTGLKSHVEVMSKEDSAALDAVRSSNYKSSHWPDHLNVLAHIRMNDRIDASGKRVLFIDEIQSDWGQEGKKLGFGYKDKTPLTTDEDRELMVLYELRANRTADQTMRMHALNNRLNASQGKPGIPAAPFVTSTDSWLNLALKRIIKLAADGGYDRVAFINGEQSADRYRLVKGIQAVSFNPETGYFVAQPKGDQSTTVETGVTPERLAKLVGQDVVAELLAAPLNDHGVHVLRDIDLTIGGNGMKVFYDTIVPNAVNALLKKTGGGRMAPVDITGVSKYPRSFPSQAAAQEWADKNLGDHDFSVRGLSESEGTYGVYDEYDHKEVMGESTLSQPGFEVTDAMREMSRMGMPLFSLETAAGVAQHATDLNTFKTWSDDLPLVAAEASTYLGGPAVFEAFHGTTHTSESSATTNVQGSKDWFDGNKVVDDSGRPLVVYHGTTKDFDRFEIGDIGFHFSSEPAGAGSRVGDAAGARIIPVHLSIKNPLRLDNDYGEFADLVNLQEMFGPQWEGIFSLQEVSSWKSLGDVTAALQAKGYDGVVYPNDVEGGGDSWIAFSPAQIKSAIGNGDFDATRPDIRHSMPAENAATPKHTVDAAKAIRASFAGPGAATANTMALSNAKSRLAAGDDAETVRQATGWHIGVDGKWRFEIHDGDARLLPAVKSLNQGGFEAKPIDSITYCQNSDGTFDLTLNPPNPQTTHSFVTLQGISRDVVDAVLPDALTNAVLRGDGEDDWIGNFKDAKRLRQPFEFKGFNALPLDQVISHPALFAAYPGLRTIHVQVDPRMGTNALFGHIGTDGRVIRMGVGQQLSSLIHEIQHGIQEIEGFASGGSVQANDANLPQEVVAQIKQISERADVHSLDGEFEEARALRAQISDIRRQVGYERYRSLAGEVEARNAQARRNMTPAQRLATAPSATADTPDHELGISFNGQVMVGAPTPASARPAAPLPESSPGTSHESIRASLARAYGPLFGRLERSGLVALAQSSRQAVNEAAAARAKVHGTTVSFERETLKQSIRQSLRAARTPGAKALLRGAADVKLSQSGQLQGFFDPVTGTSFLVADNLSIDTAPGVLIHEVGIHMASSAALEPLFERAADLLKTGAGTPFFDRVIQRMRLAEETCPEEAAAYLAEEYEFDRMHAPKTVVSWMGDFKATVRAWLYLKGAVIQVENLGPADIAAVARANARSLVTCARRETRLRHSIAAGRCASPWYSELARQVQALNQPAMPADQFAGWIKALTTKGVTPDEIEWSGVLDWLKLREGKVTKADIASFLASNGVQIEEHVLGASPDIFSHSVVDWKGRCVEEFDDEDEAREYAAALQNETDDPYKVQTCQSESPDGARYGEYALEGGKNYRELLLTLPELPCKPAPYDALRRAMLKSKVMLSLDEHAELQAMNGKREQSDFKSSHWENHPNVLAHVRLDDRIDAQGNHILMVHELQSDWGQAGRKKGFRPTDIEQQQEQYKAEMKALYPLGHNDRRRTPDEVARGEALDKAAVGAPIAPFVTSTDGWLSLVLKRIIKLAADESYDKVAFISGEQSVERYKLSNKIDALHWREMPDGKHVTVNFVSADGLTLVVDPQGSVIRANGNGPENRFTGKLLDAFIGKSAAEKITAQPSGSLSGDGLNIGGEGMRLFYDRIVPSMVKDMLRKLGGVPLESVGIAQGVDRELLDEDGKPYVDKAPVSEQCGFTLTDAMRRQVSGGMPLFGRAVAASGAGQTPRTRSAQTCT